MEDSEKMLEVAEPTDGAVEETTGVAEETTETNSETLEFTDSNNEQDNTSKEVQEFANLDKEKTVFPISVQFLGKKGAVKNKVFKNIESLNSVIEQMENDELVL